MTSITLTMLQSTLRGYTFVIRQQTLQNRPYHIVGVDDCVSGRVDEAET